MANVSNVKVKRGNKLVLSGSSVEITGSATTTGDLVVGGKITANELNITYVTSSVLLQSGSTKFGDTPDDTHQFTGSVLLSGTLSASALSASSFVGGNASFTTLSASAAELSGNVLIYGTASLSSNPSAAYIVYNSGVDKLVVFPGLVVSGNIQTTGSVSASSFTGSGASLTNLTASNITNFTNDVRAQFSEGTGISIVNGQISATSTADITEVAAGTNLTGGGVSGSVTLSLTSSITGGLTDLTASNISASLGKFNELSASAFNINGTLTATNISASTISGTFSGSGALLNNLTASNVNNFSSDVRSLFSATGGITYDSGSGQFSSSISQGITDIVAGNNIGIVANGTVVTASLSSSVTGLTNLSSSAITGSNVLINSSLLVNASFARTRVTVNTAHTVTSTDQIVLASITGSGDLVVTLPAPTAIDGRELVVKRVDDATQAGSVVISSSNGGTIDSSDTFFELNGPFQSATLLADSGSNKWFVI